MRPSVPDDKVECIPHQRKREREEREEKTYNFNNLVCANAAMRSKPEDAIKAPDVPIVLTDKFKVTTIIFRGTRKMFIAVERIVFGM